ncbi:hypothetical protein CRE_28964 [Caenorhabditis remanei]|uniref:Uncharacterized protein n=1 Tax=Caenorhabditis remanei TaxID=31234 RepID=E3N583_CAERE|nr:hypothetical protein CRE_28964 [Caenorhabditis remanei]
MVVIDVITLDDDDDDVCLQKARIPTPRYGIFRSIRGDDDTPIQNPDDVPWKIEDFFFSSEDVTSSRNSEALRHPKIEESESQGILNPENSGNSSGDSGAPTSSGFRNSKVLRDPKIEDSESVPPPKSQNSKNLTSSENSGVVTRSKSILNPSKSQNPNSGVTTSSGPHQNLPNQTSTSSGYSGAPTSSGFRNSEVLRDPKTEDSESVTSSKFQNSKNPTSSGDSGAPTTLKNFTIPKISNSGIPSLLEIPLISKPPRLLNSTSSGHQNHQNPPRNQNSTSSGNSGVPTSSRPLQNHQNPPESGDFPVLELYKDPKKMSRGERKKYRQKLQLEAVMVAGQIKQLRMLSAEYVKQEDQEVTQFQRANQEKLTQLMLQDTQIRSEFRKACGSTAYLDQLIRNAGCAGYIPKPSAPPANTSDHPKRTFPNRDVIHQNPVIPEKRIKVETA